VVVSDALQTSSRRLLIALHHTSPKNGGAEEWTLLLDELVRTIHLTADQTFRSVKEFWESAAGYMPSSVDLTQEAHGGGIAQGELPDWIGVSSGIARISGLVQTISECFAASTRMPVLSSIDAVLDVCSRLTSIVPPDIGGHKALGGLNVNPNVGREERDELWSSLPSMHLSVLDLLRLLLRRLGSIMLPAIPEMLSMASRSFATMATCDENVQEHGFQIIKELLLLAGPALPKASVMLLKPVTQLCCDVLLQAAGHPKADLGKAVAQLNGTKVNGLAAHADSIFPTEKVSSNPATRHNRQAGHLVAATKLLPVLLSHLPQRCLSQDQRSLIDRTAIVTKDRDAMLASCLHPYTDARGRLFSSITPFLCQAFPDDQAIEILRSNVISPPNAADMEIDPAETDGDSKDVIDSLASLDQTAGRDALAGAYDEGSQGASAFGYPDLVSADRTQLPLDVREQSSNADDMAPSAKPQSLLSDKSGYGPPVAFIQTNALKRGIEEVETDVTVKRIDAGKGPMQAFTGSATLAGSDSSDGEEAQLDMTLELDEEDSEMEE
jgi:pre-rRNA-processing protein RIX1